MLKRLPTNQLICVLLLGGLFQAPVQAQSDTIDLTLEIIEFNCATRPDQLEDCNAALRQLAAPASLPDLAAYESVMPGRRVISYTTTMILGQSLEDSTSSGDSVLEVGISMTSPMAGRYQLDVEARHSNLGETQSMWASSMLITAAGEPLLMGSSTKEGLELVAGEEREVVVVELDLLTVAER